MQHVDATNLRVDLRSGFQQSSHIPDVARFLPSACLKHNILFPFILPRSYYAHRHLFNIFLRIHDLTKQNRTICSIECVNTRPFIITHKEWLISPRKQIFTGIECKAQIIVTCAFVTVQENAISLLFDTVF
jgi:hypothetical protein